MRRLPAASPIPNEGRLQRWPDGSLRWLPRPDGPKKRRNIDAERIVRRRLRLGAR